MDQLKKPALVSQFAQARFLKAAGVRHRRCRERSIPVKIGAALIVDGRSYGRTVEVRSPVEAQGCVRRVNHSISGSSAAYDHAAGSAIVDGEVAWQVSVIGERPARHA